jgi:hypothetical protein
MQPHTSGGAHGRSKEEFGKDQQENQDENVGTMDEDASVEEELLLQSIRVLILVYL